MFLYGHIAGILDTGQCFCLFLVVRSGQYRLVPVGFYIYIFIAVSRLQVYEEKIKWFLCLPLPDVNHVSDFVAAAK